MSGPIVRKYGFPNFDKIFGPKPILHGAEEQPSAERSESDTPAQPAETSETPEARPADQPAPPR